ncbi:multifunctional CCA protein [Methyloglobulus morosus KoM1]|uniref:Multifunctional CCA protein n=1 Tax=Methyloglobulus morosus KoM1 TaxID=1116472 RepID=V5BI28_9GAMM|nr:multifunctional tRNA nucleotidyltransferase/2',3'-cyclic phosphodiesterase/2' nucleotidase/2'phosphatase [Methyloglobulus morosus]ESS67404.1 multifunctional CCA protein [Methyloglobulus morosus KoM1]
MKPESTPELMQADPGLSVFRLAALYAGTDGRPDDETLELMFEQVSSGVIRDLAPLQIWPELARGLMASKPSNMFRALYACGALSMILPEVSAVFGVPQIAGDPPQVDIGQHLLRALDEASLCSASLPVRYALMVMNIGKSDSPLEHLPVHYRHVERGEPRIHALCERFGVPSDCRDLALLALSECERVHRVSEIRAGPVAAMLERVGAFEQPDRFADFMLLCTYDFRAYPGNTNKEYVKADLLYRALAACAEIDADAIKAAQGSLQDARAFAIADAFHSVRWS